MLFNMNVKTEIVLETLSEISSEAEQDSNQADSHAGLRRDHQIGKKL